MARESIEIVFSSQGHRQVERNTKRIATAARDLEKNAKAAKDAISKMFAALSNNASVRQVNKIQQSVQNLGRTAVTASSQMRGLNNTISSSAASQLTRQIAILNRTLSQMGKVSSFVSVHRQMQRTGRTAQQQGGRIRSFFQSLIVPPATGASLRETNRTLVGLVGTFGAFYTARFAAGTVDEFNRMGNVLKGFGVAADEVDAVRVAINKVSNEARVDATQAATLFGRIKQATSDLGLSNEELVTIVGTANKALRLGGASALEASQSLRQLSQAFNKGKLDGDEFRSVMENAPILQDLLTERLGVTKDALFDLAAEGKITAKDLVAALQEGASAIDEQMLQQVETLGDALTVLKNEFREAFGQQTGGAIGSLVSALKLIAQNMDNLVRLLRNLVAVKVFTSLASGALTLAKNIQLAAANMARFKAVSAAAAASTAFGGAAKAGVGARLAFGLGVRGAASAIPVIGQIAMVGLTLYELADIFGFFGKSADQLADEATAAADRLAKKSRELAAERGTSGQGAQFAAREMAQEIVRRGVRGQQLKKQIAEGTTQSGGVWVSSAGARGVAPPVSTGIAYTEEAKQASEELRDLILKYETDLKTGATTLEDALRSLGSAAEPLLIKEISGQFEDLASALGSLQQIAKYDYDTLLNMGAVDRLPPGPVRLSEAEIDLRLNEGRLKLQLQEIKAGVADVFKDGVDSKILVDNVRKAVEETRRQQSGVPSPLETAYDRDFLLSLLRTLQDYSKKIKDLAISEQEAMGDSFTQAADKIQKYKERLELLNDATKEYPAAAALFANAIAYISEKLDAATGGFAKATTEAKEFGDQIRKLTDDQIRLIGNEADLKRIAEELKGGASPDEAIAALKAERDALKERLRALGIIDDQNDAIRKQNAAEASVLETLRRKRAELEAIGKTQQQLARQKFIADGPTPEQLQEYDQLTIQFSEGSFTQAIQSGIQELRQAAIELNRLQAEGPKDEAGAAKIKAELDKFRELASRIGDTIGQAGNEGADEILKSTAEFLKTNAGEVGTQLGTALANAFNAAVQGVRQTIQNAPGAGPAALGPGYGPGPDTSRLDVLTGRAEDLLRSLQSGNEQLAEMRANFGGLGSFGAAQLDKLSNSAENTANEFQNFFESAFGTLEDALVEFVTTGEFDFKKFINAIIADLARLVIRMLIIRPLMNFFGGIFGFGFANGGLVPGSFGTPGGTVKKLATGSGVIGGYGGTTSDRYLAAVSPGEFVVNASATRRNYADLLRMNNGGTARGKQKAAGGQTTINYAPQITVVNEGGGAGDGQQQGEQIGTMVRQSFTELLMRETRPGGMLESLNRREFL